MKQITTYSYKGNITLSEESISKKTYRPLSKQEHSRVSFVPLFDETYLQEVANTQVVKLNIETRKEPDSSTIDQVVKEKLSQNPNLEESVVAEETYVELKSLTGTTSKNVTAFVNNGSGTIMLDATRKLSDEVFHELMSIFEGEYEDLKVVVFEAPIGEKLLTDWTIDDCPEEPFCLGEITHLGQRSEIDKSPKKANIKIEKVYANDSEVLQHIDNNNVVKLLQLEYDGVIDLVVSSDMFVSKIKFKDHLKFKPDEDSTDAVNFMTQYELQLPDIFGMIGTLEQCFSETKV